MRVWKNDYQPSCSGLKLRREGEKSKTSVRLPFWYKAMIFCNFDYVFINMFLHNLIPWFPVHLILVVTISMVSNYGFFLMYFHGMILISCIVWTPATLSSWFQFPFARLMVILLNHLCSCWSILIWCSGGYYIHYVDFFFGWFDHLCFSSVNQF